MSKIEELLKNEKVEWRKLGDVCEIKTGQTISKSFISNNLGKFPVINSGKEPLGYVNLWNTENDPIGITTRGAGVGSITYQEGKYFRGNLNYSVTIKNIKEIEQRFLYHVLINMKKEIHQLCTFNGIPALNSSELKKLQIPIPSIEAQEKIVETLDKFTNYVTELQAELQAELQVRTKQYEYYRDMLLSEEYLDKITKKRAIVGNVNSNPDNIKMEKLKECILNVEKIKWKEKKSCLFKYIDLSSVARDNHCITSTDTITADNAPSRAQQIVCSQDVLFGTTRPLLQRYCLIPEEYDRQICSTGFCVLRADKNKVLPKWILYTISSSLFLEHIKVYEKGTSYPSISDKDVKLFKIPVPSKQVQEYIIEILDKLNCLINDVSKSLPKEIELRQKQYEYYREKLLDFKK